MLLIERIPTLSILERNQSGLGPTVTFSIRRAEKKGHSLGDSNSITVGFWIGVDPSH